MTERERILTNQHAQLRVSFCNVMDRYSDLLTAAGITGMAFMGEDVEDLHDQAIKRIEGIVRRHRIPPVKLLSKLDPITPPKRPLEEA